MYNTFTVRPKVLATLAAIIFVTISLVLVSSSARADVASGAAYLQGETISPWSSMALVAAGLSSDGGYLRGTSGSKAIDIEAPILALTALGHDPRTYPDDDLVAKLKEFFDGSQIGDSSTYNDDAFGILALASAGLPDDDPVIDQSKKHLIGMQNDDGGWSFASGGSSDTNTTAAVIMALIEAGVSSADAVIVDGIDYLKNAQNADGGFPYDPVSQWGTASDSSSTAWIVMALTKAGISPSSWTAETGNPVTYLESLQDASGFFHFQPGDTANGFTPITTSYGLIALANKSLPVGFVDAPAIPKMEIDYRIEGSSAMVCEGTILTTGALQMIKDLASVCDYEYNIKETSYGPYLQSIGTDVASGSKGWLYAVNLVAPQVGAADYELKDGDDVLWYFGDFNLQLTRLALSDNEVATGEVVTVTLEYFDGSVWIAHEGATVHYADGRSVSADSNGKATLTLADGAYHIYATKEGYVRTESERVIVGKQIDSTVSLSATITEGGSGGNNDGGDGNTGSSVTFTIDTSNVSFGAVAPGSSNSKDVILKNGGSENIIAGSSVSGDSLFRDYLSINNIFWRLFTMTLAPGVEKKATVKLSVPSGYGGTGDKAGSLIFWVIVPN